MSRFANLLFILLFAHCFALRGQDSGNVIPFQGQLANQAGQPLSPTNAVTIVFRLYRVPVGGVAIWEESQPNISVNAGRFSVLLGSRTELPAPTNFNATLYLGITVDDGDPATADLEMRPRQALVPVISARYAQNADKLAGYGWSDVFAEGATNPATAKLSGSRIVNQTITSTQLATNSVTRSQIALGEVTTAAIASGAIGSQQITNGAVGALQIAQGGIQASNLADGAVTLPKLAPRQIAFSQSSGTASYSISSSSETTVPNLTVTLVTTGRPVLVFLSSVQPAQPVAGINDGVSFLQIFNGGLDASINYNIYRSTTLISRNRLEFGFGSPGIGAPYLLNVPPSCIQFIDSPPAGPNTYSVTVSGISSYSSAWLSNVRLVALEL